ncbi:hypothetical protein EMCG_05624 [[Emmonsia] crescens]|uniref:NACHT-NTPase and P-loop NTPases N-terminal domain-containing protein n=1 Tax=[Emmonsia] crescens TaxID=73230 RepID=A0A0G2IEH2_9EURO|nr:hypothetical protein EMCG_05624 [Emmonsia crescens UAMH 3008]
MAEALAAVGVASSIVQLIDFTVKVTNRLCITLRDLHAITLELPSFAASLRETKSRLDLKFYGPSAVAATQGLVDECTCLMTILEGMPGNFLPRKYDFKMARSWKTVYAVTHEKVIPAIPIRAFRIYQEISAISKILEDLLPLGPSHMATCSAGNETLQNPMKDDRIARKKNRTTHSSRYNSRFPSSINLSRLGLLRAIRIPLNLLLEARSYTLYPTLQLQRLVKRTSPGFEVFWKCDNHVMDVSDGLVELRRIFQDRRAPPFDADPDGRNWLELLFDFRGGGDQAVRLQFLKMIVEYNSQIYASIPIQPLCFPILTHALPNPVEPAALNTNLVIEEGDGGVYFLKNLFHENRNWTRGVGYIQSEDPFYLKLIRNPLLKS